MRTALGRAARPPSAPARLIEVLDFRRVGLVLERRESVCLRDAAGLRIVCRVGALWITQHDDPRDRVLQAGESWLIDRAGATLVHAAERSEIGLEAAAPTARIPIR